VGIRLINPYFNGKNSSGRPSFGFERWMPTEMIISLKQVRGYFQNDPVFNIAAIFAIIGAFSFGCLAFLALVINVDFAFHAPPLDSPIVGWSTIHQYPKQQESFYYIAGVVTVVGSTLIALLSWVWSAAALASVSRAAHAQILKVTSLTFLPGPFQLWIIVNHWPPSKGPYILLFPLAITILLFLLFLVLFWIGPHDVRTLYRSGIGIHTAVVIFAGVLTGWFVPFLATSPAHARMLAFIWWFWPVVFFLSWIGWSRWAAGKTGQSFAYGASRYSIVFLPAAAFLSYPFLLTKPAARLIVLLGILLIGGILAFRLQRTRARRDREAKTAGSRWMHVWLAATLALSAGFAHLATNPQFIHGVVVNPLDGDYLLAWVNDGLQGKLPFKNDYYYPYGPLLYYEDLLSAKVFGIDRYTLPTIIANTAASVAILYAIGGTLFFTPLFAVLGGLIVLYQVAFLRVLMPCLALLVSVRAIEQKNRKLMFWSGTLYAISLLYSIESGLCALIAVGVVIMARALQSGKGAWVEVVARNIRSLLAGASVVLVPALVVGGALGMLSGYVRSMWTTLSVADACCGLAFPSLLHVTPSAARVFPLLQTETFRTFYFAPTVYVISAIYLVFRWASNGKLCGRDIALLGMLAFGGLLFRSALGRGDAGHTFFSSVPGFLMAAVLMERACLSVLAKSKRRIEAGSRPDGSALIGVDFAAEVARRLLASVFVAAILTLPNWHVVLPRALMNNITTLQYYFLFRGLPPVKHPQPPREASTGLGEIRSDDGSVFWFPLASAGTVAKVVGYLKAHLGPNDRIFCFPYVTRYYFLLSRTSLGAFGPAIWSGAADPKDQRRLAETLKAESPKYIVYDEAEWPDTDGVPWIDRAGVIADYIFQNYHLEKQIGSALLLTRGRANVAPPNVLAVGDASSQLYLIRGWYHAESMGQAGRWTTLRASASLSRPAGATDLHVDFMVPKGDRKVLVSVDGAQVSQIDTAETSGEQHLIVGLPSAAEEKTVKLEFDTDKPLPTPDARALGIWVHEIGFGPHSLPPRALAVSPNVGARLEQQFRFQYMDPDGADHLAWVQMIVNSAQTGAKACYINYDVENRRISLAGDSGQEWPIAAPLGTAQLMENSQCALDLLRSSAKKNGMDLIVTLSLKFKPAFGGAKRFFLLAQDKAGNRSDWATLGNWQVPASQ
jgi:hypothetical protein